MRSRPCIGVTVGLLVILAGEACAQPATTAGSPELQSPSRTSGWLVIEKLGRGLGNFAFGWVEIPDTIQRRYREHDAPTSFFSGLFIGLFKAVGRTAVGVYETVTFIIPHQPVLPPIEHFTPYHVEAPPVRAGRNGGQLEGNLRRPRP